jgi:hypothetical protein
MLSDREKFLVANTILVSTETAKKLNRTTRQQMLSYIRERHCPSVTDDDWRDITSGINSMNAEVTRTMMSDYQKKDIREDSTLLKLDGGIRDVLGKIDVDSLKSDDPQIQKMIDEVKQKKSDMGL